MGGKALAIQFDGVSTQVGIRKALGLVLSPTRCDDRSLTNRGLLGIEVVRNGRRHGAWLDNLSRCAMPPLALSLVDIRIVFANWGVC